MRFLPLLILLLVSSAAAQTSDFVVLAASGDTLRGHVELRDPFLKRAYVRVDSQRVEIEDVREFREGETLFAVVERRNLARLVRQGERVDFYARYVTSSTPGMMVPTGGPGSGMTMTPGTSSTEEIAYYRLDGGPVERASASNLRIALADNPESLRALDQYQNLTYAQYGTTAVGLGAFAAGAALTLASEENGEYSVSPLTFVGVGLLAISNLVFPSQRRAKVRLAIDAYNR